ncbi:MAG: protoporphyrinogen oxidase, partial [Mycobacteriales bacterium]
FATLHDGLGDLPAAVAAASGAEILLGTAVCDITRTAAGFRLLTGPVPGRHYVDADAVVLAVPAGKSASLLRSTAPAAATELAGVEYASIALVTLAYRPGSTLPAGSGVLVPSTEGLAIKAITFTTQKWPHRGGGAVLLRASVGRHGDERVLQRSDGELAAVVAEQVALTTGIGSPPIDRLVTRWGGALPQYAVGHLDRVARIRAAVDGVPGLAVCGAAYDGVGVPACIRTGEQAAARIAAHLTSVAAAGGQSDHG